MTWRIAGLIEGFYGRPWTWDERVAVARHCAERGMRDYVYAPKDDPKHRASWREPYDEAELSGFRRLADEGGLRLGFGLSPGLSIDYGSGDDREAFWQKIEQVLDTGVSLVCLALDDIPNRPGLGEDHAAFTTWLHARLDGRAALVLVPTEYVGTRPTPYLSALADGVPDDVPIGWTGMAVVNDRITAGEAAERAASLGGRPPLLWDNFPVNDAIMSDRLFLGPLWGRDPDLAAQCSGYLANPMVQPRASMLPLASVAGWLRGDDPLDVWAAEAEATGLRVFAEACDGSVPRMLVQALADEVGGPGWAEAAAPLGAWLSEAASCGAPGLEGEADEWVAQVHAEASLGLDALRLYQATRPALEVDDEGLGRAAPPSDEQILYLGFAVMTQWAAVRRGRATVMGARCSVRPAIGQREDGGWVLRADALEADANAVDALVRLALDEATDSTVPGPLWVGADGAQVEVDVEGRFLAPAGSVVLARCGQRTTRARGAMSPPVPDRRFSD